MQSHLLVVMDVEYKMALSKEHRNIAEKLLQNMARDDLADLIEVLQYFNRRCREDVRHLCLIDGCSNETEEEKRLREIEVIERKSQDVYLSTSRPVCKCCGR